MLQAAHLNRELWPGFTPLPEQIQILGIVFGIGLNPLLTYRVNWFLISKAGNSLPLCSLR